MTDVGSVSVGVDVNGTGLGEKLAAQIRAAVLPVIAELNKELATTNKRLDNVSGNGFLKIIAGAREASQEVQKLNRDLAELGSHADNKATTGLLRLTAAANEAARAVDRVGSASIEAATVTEASAEAMAKAYDRVARAAERSADRQIAAAAKVAAANEAASRAGNSGGGGGGSGGGGGARRPGGGGGRDSGLTGGGGGVLGFLTGPVGLNALALGSTAVGPALLGITNLTGAVQQLGQAGILLPGIFAAAGSSLGTAKIATLGMSTAVKDLFKALGSGDPKELKKANAEIALLPKNVQETVHALGDLFPALKDVQTTLANNMFDGVGQQIRDVGAKDIPIFKSGLGQISTAWNGTVKTMLGVLGSDSTGGFLTRIFGNTAQAQTIANAAIAPITHALGTLAATGTDFLPRLAKGFDGLADRVDNFVTKSAANGNLDRWINQGIDASKNLGTSFLNVLKIVNDLTTAAGGDGGFLKALNDGSTALHNFLSSTAGQNTLKSFFADARAEWQQWKPILIDLAQDVGQVFNGLHDWGSVILPIFGQVTDFLTNTPGLVSGLVTGFLAFGTLGAILSKFGDDATKGAGGVGNLLGKLSGLQKAGGIAGIAALLSGNQFINPSDGSDPGTGSKLGGAALNIGGGALAGFSFGGPVGAAIGAAIGAAVSLAEAVTRGLNEARDKFQAQLDRDKDPNRPGNPSTANQVTGRDRVLQPSLTAPTISASLIPRIRAGQVPGYAVNAQGQVINTTTGQVVPLPGNLTTVPPGTPPPPLPPPASIANLPNVGGVPFPAVPGPPAPPIKVRSDVIDPATGQFVVPGSGGPAPVIPQGTNPILAGPAAGGVDTVNASIKAAIESVGVLSRDISSLPNGSVKISDTTPEVINRLKQLGLAVTQLPGGTLKVTVQYIDPLGYVTSGGVGHGVGLTAALPGAPRPVGSGGKFAGGVVRGFANGGVFRGLASGGPFDWDPFGVGGRRTKRIIWWGGKDGLPPRNMDPTAPIQPIPPRVGFGDPNIFGGLPNEWPPNNNFPKPGDSRWDWWQNRRNVGGLGFASGGRFLGFDGGGAIPEGPDYYAQAFANNGMFATPSATGWQTRLSPDQERQFQAWVGANSVPFDPAATAVDYDMRGFWLNGGANAWSPGSHFPDTYKTPYDTTFSNESKYAIPGTPFGWRGDSLIDQRTGKPVQYGGRAGGGRAGLLPGYSPGIDNMLVPLSGGEGIIIPEAMRALGASWLYRLNSKFRSGISRQGYATGGVNPGGLPGVDPGAPIGDPVVALLTQIRDLLAGSGAGDTPLKGIRKNTESLTSPVGAGLPGQATAGTKIGPFGTPLKQKGDPAYRAAAAAIQALGGDPEEFLGTDPTLTATAGAAGTGGLASPDTIAALTQFAQTGIAGPGVDITSPQAKAILVARNKKKGGLSDDQISGLVNSTLTTGTFNGQLDATNTPLIEALLRPAKGTRAGVPGGVTGAGLPDAITTSPIAGAGIGQGTAGIQPVFVVNFPGQAVTDIPGLPGGANSALQTGAGAGGGAAAGPGGATNFLGKSIVDAATGAVGSTGADLTGSFIDAIASGTDFKIGTPTAASTPLSKLVQQGNPLAAAAAFGLNVPDYTRDGGTNGTVGQQGQKFDAKGRMYSDAGSLIDRTMTDLSAQIKASFDQLKSVINQVKDNTAKEVLEPLMKTAVTEGIAAMSNATNKMIGAAQGEAAAPPIADAVGKVANSAYQAGNAAGSASGGSAVGSGLGSIVDGFLPGSGSQAAFAMVNDGGWKADGFRPLPSPMGVVGGLYDEGGLWPSGTFGTNLSGAAERVLDPVQTQLFDAGMLGGWNQQLQQQHQAAAAGVDATSTVGADFFGVSQIPVLGAIINLFIGVLLKLIGVQIDARNTLTDIGKDAREFRGAFQKFDATGRLINDTSAISDRSSTSDQEAADERIRILKLVIEGLIKFIIEKIIIPIGSAVANAAISAGGAAAGAGVNSVAPGAGGIVSALITSGGQAGVGIVADLASSFTEAATPVLTDSLFGAIQSFFPGLTSSIFGGGLLSAITNPLQALLSPLTGGIAGLFATLLGGLTFDEGGVASGVGLMPKATIRPERVLSPSQTQSFDRLVTALERGGRNGNQITVHAPFTVAGGAQGAEQAHTKLLSLLGGA